MPTYAAYHAGRHRLTVATAAATAVLLFAGGLVTSTGSGLAVPDWPLSFGGLFPEMTGGVLYEHGHRMIAFVILVLTAALAVWYRSEPRPAVRRAALAALLAVLAQAILGGTTVLLRLPAVVSVLHACLAQGFFCLLVLLAMATSRSFVEGPPVALPDEGAPPFRHLAAAATGLTFAQLVLGAVMRHTGAGLAIPDLPLAFGRVVPPFVSAAVAVHYAHRVLGLVTAAAIAGMAWRALRQHRGRRDVVVPATIAAGLAMAQIALGATAVLTRLAVLPTTLHLLNGALILACCTAATFAARRGRAGRGAPVPRPVGVPVEGMA